MDTGPNGGGLYVNQYTMIFDILEPGPLNWTPFFNTNPDNPGGNDADFYLAYDGSLGIAALGYTSNDVVLPNEWYRIAFVADLATNFAAFYVNGNQVFQTTGGGLLDGRFSLNSNQDAGPDLRLFNEGDTSGQYTHELYISSFYSSDSVLSPAEIMALGGPDADGIAGFSGDFNLDGNVDAADYVIWRKSGGSLEQYTEWRSNFGLAPGSGAAIGGLPSSAVPEPVCNSLIGVACLALAGFARRR